MTIAVSTQQKRRGQPPSDQLVGAATLIRPVREADLPALQAWDNDPAIIALMGQKYAKTDIVDWFDSLRTDRSCRAFVIETLEGRLIGELELAHINRRTGSAELRICIGETDCWNQGFGTDALNVAIRLAMEGLGLRAVYLRVFAFNARAIKVYQRLGFRKEAILAPSSRRNDPSPVVLMNLTRERWNRLTSA